MFGSLMLAMVKTKIHQYTKVKRRKSAFLAASQKARFQDAHA